VSAISGPGKIAPSTLTTCPYCGVGCGVIATVKNNGTIEIKGDPDHPANFGRLCSKGSALAETLDLEDRLLYPEINGKQTSWETALEHVASRILQSIEVYGPESVAFYVSGQLTTEDYYVANKLMKGFIGTANIDTNSRLCMSSAVAGYKRAFGADFVPCNYSDLEQADLILIVGSNTAWCHPVIYQRIIQAREDNPALKIIVIDPRKTMTCDIADLHLPIKPGTDVALFNGLLNHLRREDALDWKFLEDYTEGFAAALQTAKDDAPSIPYTARVCDLNELDVAEFFRLFSRINKTVTLFSQGVNQSSQGTDKVNAIINCHLATGRIGKSGTGPFSITGQPNAMGGREVGGLANQLAAHMDMDNPEHLKRVRKFWGSFTIADKPGLKAVELLDAIHRGEIKTLWIMATNPVVSLPDADKVRDAIKKCETVIVSDCIRHTDTNQYADILLPALAWGEKDGTVTNSERCISRQRKFLVSPGEANPDWWIVTQVAQRMGFEKAFAYNTNADIFREHATLSGFENNGQRDFDISALANLDDEQYDRFEPVQWPIKANQTDRQKNLSDGVFFHENGKARFIAVTYQAPVNAVDIEYPFILNTGRVRDHWHTLSRTGKSPRLSQHISEPYAEIHPDDAARMKIADRQLMQVTSRWGSVIIRSRINNGQRQGSIFVPIHWNDQYASQARINSIVNPVTDPISGQPESKHTPVNIFPLNMAWEGFLITRKPLKTPLGPYWVKYRGDNYWHYELAGTHIPENWQEWAHSLMQYHHALSDWLEYSDASIGRYRAADIRNGKLENCLFIARDQTQLPDRNWLQSLFREKTLEKIQRACLLAGRSADKAQDTGHIVCSCFSVGRKTITRAIFEKGFSNITQIGEYLQAGTNCGSCIPELRQLLAIKSASSDAA
jgi:assimilatory nitrate reductase catalytic subunit